MPVRNNFLQLLRGTGPKGSPTPAEVRIWAAADGSLWTTLSDGTAAPVAGPGALPNPTDDGDVLTVVEGEWVGAPGGGSQPVVILGEGPPITQAVYTVTLNGNPDGGTFRLYENESGEPTDDIAFDADGDAVTEAFVFNFGDGAVTATGPVGGPWEITFNGEFGLQPLDLTIDDNSLTHGGDPVADPTIATVTVGGGPLPAPAGALYADTANGNLLYLNTGTEEASTWESKPLVQAIYSGDAVEIADGDIQNLTWDTLQSGVDLLDRTDPSAPTVLVAGFYAVTEWIVSTEPITPGGIAILSVGTLALDYFTGSAERPDLGLSGATVVFLTPGDPLLARVTSRDGVASRSYLLASGVLVKLA